MSHENLRGPCLETCLIWLDESGIKLWLMMRKLIVSMGFHAFYAPISLQFSLYGVSHECGIPNTFH